MARIYRHILSLLLIISIISCDKAKSFRGEIFPETISLSGKEKMITGVYLKYPFRIRLSNSSLYVMDIHPNDYYCHEFGYPSMKFKHSFIKRGQAPNEFLDAENIRIDNKGGLWLLDANRKKIVNFEHGKINSPLKTFQLNEDLIRTLDFDLIDDSTFVVPDYSGLNRICFVNHKGNIVRKSFAIPSKFEISKKNASKIALAQAWRSFLHYNPKNRILAMVTQLGQVLEIYDLKNRRIVNIIRQQGLEPEFIVNGNYAVPTGIMGYSDVYVGQKCIYAIFWGHSFEDIRQGKETKEGGRYIHVFDLKGNPIRQYILDRYITGFHIDEKEKRIIGLDVNSDQPVVEYSF